MGGEFLLPVIKGLLSEAIARKRLTIQWLTLIYILFYTLPPSLFDRFSTHAFAHPWEGASRQYPLLDTSAQGESIRTLTRWTMRAI